LEKAPLGAPFSVLEARWRLADGREMAGLTVGADGRSFPCYSGRDDCGRSAAKPNQPEGVPMILYPTIELMNGRCVSLIGGDLDNPQIWHVDPVRKAREFAAAGAEWMHVTDLDAVAGTGDNAALIEEIIRQAGIPVQIAGGIRTGDHVAAWLD
jgi:hypothetical protein